jgi:hypothetical protein
MSVQEKKLIFDLYKHYKSITEISDHEINLLYGKYGNIRNILKNLIQEFDPHSSVSEKYLDDKLNSYTVPEIQESDINPVITLSKKNVRIDNTILIILGIIVIGIIVFFIFSTSANVRTESIKVYKNLSPKKEKEIKSEDLINSNKYTTIEEFQFDKYSSGNELNNIKKAPLNTSSNKFIQTHKTRISKLYENIKINFARNYTIIYWDAGMGSTLGTIIDYSTGKAYDIPLNDETAYIGCMDNNKLEKFNKNFADRKVFFKSNSKLLVLRSCDEYGENAIIFRFYLWDEKFKKFNLLKVEKNKFN